jgi:hypothetical protein
VIRAGRIRSDSMTVMDVDEVLELFPEDRDKNKLEDYSVSYQVTLVETLGNEKLEIFLRLLAPVLFST